MIHEASDKIDPTRDRDAPVSRERPILFSAPMVRAILDGSKTQTRRIVKPQPDFATARESSAHMRKALGLIEAAEIIAVGRYGIGLKTESAIGPGIGYVQPNQYCPYGTPGDRLWSRESHRLVDCPCTETCRMPGHVYYEADGSGYENASLNRLRPSIHMPRWASRFTLEVVSVHVERLQSISPEDCLAEGISQQLFIDLIGKTAARLKKEALHWLSGDADSHWSYCRECAWKEMLRLKAINPQAELILDGGWPTAEDSQAFCETCATALICNFSQHCIGAELDHFEMNGFPLSSPGACDSFLEMIGVAGFHGPHADGLKRLAYRILWESINGPGSWDENPWVWVVEFKRSDLPEPAVGAGRVSVTEMAK